MRSTMNVGAIVHGTGYQPPRPLPKSEPFTESTMVFRDLESFDRWVEGQAAKPVSSTTHQETTP